MRGLIYKEFSIFYKCIDRKMIAIAFGFTALLIYKAGIYGGFMASIMFAMAIGIQNVMSFASDDKVHWKKYQMALPMSDLSVVASKYISVVCTLGISFLGSMVFSLLSSVAFGTFNITVWGLAGFAAVFIPLIWTGICLPFTYWFGMQSAQAMGIFIVFPVTYVVKYFEDHADFSVMADSISSYLSVAGIAILVVFGVSMAISTAGYARRK